MKAIVTVGILLSLLITAAIAQEQVIPAIRLEEPVILTPEQQEKNIEICTQNLIKLGKSIEAYLEVNGDYPEWLSDLYHPKYLPDPDVLICPADRHGGRALYPRNVDPKMPVSYGYQLNPAYRKRALENRAMYGDAVPMVRCRHHPTQKFHCLNLSFSYKIYPSSSAWQFTPEDLYGSVGAAITALEAGLQKMPNDESFFYVYSTLVRLYIEDGREKDVDQLINRFKSVMNVNSVKNNFTLADMLEQSNRNEDALQLLKKLKERFPNDNNVLLRLAAIHEKLENNEDALELFKKLEADNPKDVSIHLKLATIYQKLGDAELAKKHQIMAEDIPVLLRNRDPAMELIGKVVPGFSATDLDGKPISLEQYRGRVVLLDFWAVWCAPCIAEMPNVKKVYDTYKDEGFDIIGISLDFDEKRLRDYLKENEISWRQVFSGKIMDNPVALHYDVRSIPTQWLIDKEGRLISSQAGGEALENMVVGALKE